MERNNDGKKSRGSQSAGIAPDTRVLWHRLSPATHYRGKKISIWLMAGRHRSAKLYIYPHGEVRDRSHWRQSLLAFPGSEVAPEQEGSRCAALAAPGLWDAVPPPLCSTSDPDGGLPPWGCKSPSRGGLRGRDTGKVHPDSYRREVAALTLPISCAIHRARSLHQEGLAKKWDTTTASVRPHPNQTSDVTHSALRPGQGQGRPGTVSMGAQGSLRFGGNLGGSWSHLLACSLYKYLLRGQDIKSTVQ